MRQIRALGVLFALVALWLVWRAPVVRRDIARYSRAAYLAMAPRMDPVRQPLVAIAQADPPQAAPLPEGKREGPGAAGRVRVARAKSSEVPPATILSPLAPARVALSPPGKGSVAKQAVDFRLSFAEAGYAALARHDRKAAAKAFRTALAEAPGDPRASAWARQLALIEKRWSGSAYVFARANGASELAVSPVLGGGQSGAQIAYSLDPLARRPFAIEARGTAPNTAVRDGSQAALGLSWQVAPAASVTIERLFGLGDQARSGWTLRAAGGAATVRPSGATYWLDLSIYAEAGAVGLRDTAYYGAVQGRAGLGFALGEHRTLVAGLGGWASAQRDQRTVDRLDLGPMLALRAGPLQVSADYRLRLGGNARPRSGPALTVAAFF